MDLILSRNKPSDKAGTVHGATAVTTTITPSIRYAGFWRRWAARLLDSIACLLIVGIVALAVLFIRQSDFITPDSGAEAFLFWSLGLPVIWCYFAVSESSALQSTFGKRALRIIVTDTHGQRIGLGRATARWLLNVLSAATLGFGYLMIAFTAKKQALHDLMTGTVVVQSQ